MEITEKIKEGGYAMCWYPKNKHAEHIGPELELYFCKVIELGKEYSKCELYFGEEFDPTNIRGIFSDVCTADLKEFGMEIKSEEEIKNLKQNWLEDSCWDIETTEGFEAHKVELKKFRLEQEKLWEDKYNEDLNKRAIKLGIPGRIDLIKYFEGLEDKIKRLEEKIESVSNDVHSIYKRS